MKKIIKLINILLASLIPVVLLTVNVSTKTIDASIDTKVLASNLISKQEEVAVATIDDSRSDVLVNDEEEDNNQEIVTEKTDNINLEANKEEKKQSEEDTSVLDTYTGTMSFYNANCRGCYGTTAAGININDGKLYYNDEQYGNVRIVAVGKEIPIWSILRIKNSSLGNNVLAIALDRGSQIGLGKTFLIDMLTNTIENKSGIEKNITVEVLRSGK